MVRYSLAPEEGLEVYLKQINETPLLTAEEEREFAHQLRAGDDKQAWQARDRMVRSNLRLVVNIAKNYSGRGVPFSDLIEEGNLGLLRAVEGFDPEQGSRFSTYASWWIKQAIKRALIGAGQPMHIPAYMAEEIYRWRQKAAELEREKGRPPTADEIIKELSLPPKRAKIVQEAMQTLISAPAATGQDSELDLSDLLVDERRSASEQKLFDESEQQVVQELLSQLDEREAKIIKLRYGLDGSKPMTLKDVGKVVGLTRERVRQLERLALQTLEGYIQQELG